MASDPAVPAVAARVLMALDRHEPDEAVLRAVAALLDPGQLDVTALYVEDEDLLRAANLPGLQEISLSGERTALDPVRIAGEMAREATAARRAFDGLAARLIREHGRLQHRFRVARGQLAEEIARAAGESDFVMISRTVRTSCLHARVGRSFAALLRQPRHVLFVNEPWATGSSVVVLHGSRLALDYADRLARTEGLRLVVAVPPVASEAELPAGAEARQLASWEEEAVAELCLREDARLLVLAELPGLDWSELLVSLMDRLPCSVLKLADRAAP